MGKILAIFTASSAGAPMESVRYAALIAGAGIAGDRYALGTGKYSHSTPPKIRHVTFIAREAIERANRELPAGTHFAPIDTRRNVLVEGIELNGLVGRFFGNKKVLFEGVELAEPCLRPPALLNRRWAEVRNAAIGRAFVTAFRHRGGLRAAIYMDARIAVDDPLWAFSEAEARQRFPGLARS
ncbi:MAG TPA: sulfurase [Candidatus Paceibacterota bacterium]|nr:sulfurase [Candidatus Paceibacterota bacterium]